VSFTWSDGLSDGGAAVIDYRIYYDQSTGTWTELDAGITQKSYTTTISLTQGHTYAFKVQARNTVGYGELSAEHSILAAQLPDQPSAPTTAIDGDNVVITWALTDYRGSPITSYTIKIRESDELTFTETLPTCDGTQATIVDTRTCSVPIATLRTAPYNIAWGSSVYATVSATNVYGTSTDSPAGNGAVILTVPTEPINLANVPTLTNGVQIGLTWEESIMNGGTAVLDYRLWSDQSTDDYMPVISNLAATSYLVTSLSVGDLYKFKIEARNAFGYSEFSDVVEILAA
jgi:hypothetical protein